MDVDDYADRNNSLEEQHFKQEIRNGSCRDTVRVAKTFLARIAEVEGRNKKAPVAHGEQLIGRVRAGAHVLNPANSLPRMNNELADLIHAELLSPNEIIARKWLFLPFDDFILHI